MRQIAAAAGASQIRRDAIHIRGASHTNMETNQR